MPEREEIYIALEIKETMEIKHIIKRDDSKEAFDANKITEAIFKAMTSANHGDHSDAQRMSASVCEIIEERSERISNYELIFGVFLQQTLGLCTNRGHIF